MDDRGKIDIEIKFIEKGGKTKVMMRKIDVQEMANLSEMEKEVIEIVEDGKRFLLLEGLKKNRKFWWKIPWLVIVIGLKTVQRKSRLLAKRCWKYSKGRFSEKA